MMTFGSEELDVLVAGAGPAGSVAALELARRGARVLLVEPRDAELPRVGESLAPDVQAALRELDLWRGFTELSPLPSSGTISVWGHAAPQAHSHLMSPYGCGWHVDRAAFDAMLTRAAVSAGASLLRGARLSKAERVSGGYTARLVHCGDRSHGAPQTLHLRARVLLDASGRSARPSRDQGADCLLFDQLVGISARVGAARESERHHLLVEATPEGWWYSAPLPSRSGAAPQMLVTLMTDADLCRRDRLSAAATWRAALERAPSTLERVGSIPPRTAPQVCCAQSQRQRRSVALLERPWVALGDAASAVDPISGSGVLRALRSGRAVAEVTRNLLERPHAIAEIMAANEAACDRDWSRYLAERAYYYAAEQRFETDFWKRRRWPLAA